MGHIGTHLDTYNKSNIPLDYFISNGILFDVRDISEITISDIEFDNIKENDFVIFRTGQIEKYPYGNKEYFENHPQLSKELINKLLDKKIRFIGIDCAGIRRGEEHKEADILCENNGIYVIENLINVEKINNNFKVYTMWFDDEEMTGLRCKVIVEI